MLENEIKEELVLIAKRVPPSDRWSLITDPDTIYPSLTDTLEAYFQEIQQPCDFRLAPVKGELYAITTATIEKAPPPPPKKYNLYGDY